MTEGTHYGSRNLQGHPKGHKCPMCVADRRAAMKKLYQETDLTLQQIADRLGLARWTVNHHLKRMGLKA